MTSALDKLKKRATEAAEAAPNTPEVHIPLSKIRFDPKQPRKAFHHMDGKVDSKDEAYIAELAATIKTKGLIQAVTLEEMDDGTYRVVVGECRTRAHLLLGLPTIRAIIRNDLTNPAERLAYQLIENVTREDLSDAELAESIAVLMKGSEGAPPMKQVEIATMLSKSEGWVTRYVKFGDDELHRLWVATGIAVTPENLYRISILPANAQVEIRRRVDLPEGHEDHLAKPVDRNVIDELSRQAKIAKMHGGNKLQGPSPQGADAPVDVRTKALFKGGDTNGVAPGDTTGQTLAKLAGEGQGAQSATANQLSRPGGQETKYTLPDAARNAILSQRPADVVGGTTTKGEHGGRGTTVLPPVGCRARLSNVRALLALLEDADKLTTVDDVTCTFNFPGTVAQDLANLLAGVVVDQREVPAVLQSELSRLQLQ